ncbi:hypothetical protein [Actinoplanes derwentensis]|uniref:20S proteasome, alpha and beta subunits n=1 Tax=Actinoplanes derwentensis TaxID=113562 RepID=A0A1H2CUY9_9ACTN|nr:hypothetical protein [Actinoplanes derwentensis]GID81989.1 hypothetical protein Ade03nite_09130 [Actinoplanes derwentensis]SDT74293.1 hypothetical protein SAMN04489716_6936 [Actinoplanes derwentensis]
MTTVVGLAGPAGVWMAADSRTNVYDRPVGGAVKILRMPLDGDQVVLVGFSGNAGMPGLARRVWREDLRLPTRGDGLQQWCDEIASLFTEPMVAAGMSDAGLLDGNFLLGVPGAGDLPSTLWTIGHHMAIRHHDDRGAVGSGEGPAIGALDALLALGTEPSAAVHQACMIAISRDRWSGRPVQQEFTPAA